MSLRVVRCSSCKSSINFFSTEVVCHCGKTHYTLLEGILSREGLIEGDEMKVRDNQARGYLSHGKFPTQINSLKSWLREIGKTQEFLPAPRNKIALDLGCGPGPYTGILGSLGYFVVAIDFSAQSLRINQVDCDLKKQGEIVFVQEDLNQLALIEQSVDLVIMADFLQHLGGRQERTELLQQVFSALKPRGEYYLSFFNLNIKNYIRGDVHGSFSNGKIRYERLIPENVISSFPENISVDKVSPMNILHKALPDKVLCALPFSRFISRMAVVTGKKEA